MRIHPKSSHVKKSRHKLLFLAQVALLPLLSMKAAAGLYPTGDEVMQELGNPQWAMSQTTAAKESSPPSYEASQKEHGKSTNLYDWDDLNEVAETYDTQFTPPDQSGNTTVAHQLKQMALEKANEHNVFSARSWGASGAQNVTDGASLLGTALGDFSEFLSFLPTIASPPKATDAVSANYFAKNYPNTFTYSTYRPFHMFWGATALARTALNTVKGLAQIGLGTLDLGAGAVVGGAKGLMAAPEALKGAARTAKTAAGKVVDTAQSAASSTKSAAQWAYKHKTPILGVALPLAAMAALAYTNPEEFQKIKSSLQSSLNDAYNATTPYVSQAASAAGSLAGEALSGAKSAAGSALSSAGSFAADGIVSAAKTATPYLMEGGKFALKNSASAIGWLGNIGAQALLETGKLSLRIASELASRAIK